MSELMLKLRVFTPLVFVFMICLPLIFTPVQPVSGIPEAVDFAEIKAEIDNERIMGHVEFFSSLGSRVTGYPGCDMAAQYIYERFVDYELSNITFEYFDVAVAYDYGANITILSTNEVIKAYPLEPNGAETCAVDPQGIEGPLVYVGTGDFSEYHDKIENSIVLMEFDSKRKWIYAAQFGAKAVIFIGNVVTRANAQEKVVPDLWIDFPRIYVSEDDGKYLRNLLEQDKIVVNIRSLMVYQNMKGRNVVGYVQGKDPSLKGEIVAVTSYYDSTSVVPSIAPGADEACGISMLLELARYCSLHPPLRTIMFVAFSGHHNGLVGARNFVKAHMNEVGSQLRLLVNIDLSTGNDLLGAFYWGAFYGYYKPLGRFDLLRPVLFNYVLPNVGEGYRVVDTLVRAAIGVITRYDFEPDIRKLDHEPFNLAGGRGFSFYTGQAYRLYRDTPFDTFEKMDFENLRPQAEFILCSLVTFTNLTPEEGVELPPLDLMIAVPREGGWVDLVGNVTEYDYSLAWYKPVPKAIVEIVATNSPGGTSRIHVIADDYGRWTFPGAPHKDSYEQQQEAGCQYVVVAGVDDPTFGPMEYSTDFGKYGGSYAVMYAKFDEAEEFRQLVVFKGGPLTIIGGFDPARLGGAWVGLQGALNFQVRIFGSDEIPDFVGLGSIRYMGQVYARSGENIEVIIRSIEAEPVGWIANASYDSPTSDRRYGSGFEVEVGKNLFVSTFDMAQDLYFLNDIRLEESRKQGATSVSTEKLHETAYTHLQKALQSLERNDYGTFYSESIVAWSLERSVYSDVKRLVLDTEHSITFFFVLLIPFSLLFERLAFEAESTLGRLLSLTGIFVLFVLVLYLIHPAFRLAQNVYMTLAGFVLTVLTAPAIILLFSGFTSKLKEIRVERLGAHYEVSGRGGVFLSALNIGIQNIKRRKLRSGLSLTAVILIIFSLISFTGITAITIVTPLEEPIYTSYEGLLLRNPQSYYEIDPTLVDFIEQFCKDGTAAKRTFIYPPEGGSAMASEGGIMLYNSEGEFFEARGAIGLEPIEANVTHLDQALVEGFWFLETDIHACIIPESIRDKLNVTVGDLLVFGGIEVIIRGIYDSALYESMTDLDNYPITPLMQGQAGSIVPLPARDMFVVPYKFARNLGTGTLGDFCIVVGMEDEERIVEVAQEIAEVFPGLQLQSVAGGVLRKFFRGAVVSVSGWQMLVAPFVIASLTILNLMLGAVYERVREIETFSSLGISPFDVVGMFLAESLIYAVIGAIAGYLVGTVANMFLHSMNLLPPGLLPNTSSSWIIIAVSLGMLATLLPTLYPAYRSSKLVTPSLERSWKMPSKPKGDVWEIPLPVIVATGELGGLIEYLKEYLEAHRTESSGSFYVRDLSCTRVGQEEIDTRSLKMIVRLAPYEAGIEQETELVFTSKGREEGYDMRILLNRITGMTNVWKSSNRIFVGDIRKQLLLWTSLRKSDKEAYILSFKKMETA